MLSYLDSCSYSYLHVYLLIQQFRQIMRYCAGWRNGLWIPPVIGSWRFCAGLASVLEYCTRFGNIGVEVFESLRGDKGSGALRMNPPGFPTVPKTTRAGRAALETLLFLRDPLDLPADLILFSFPSTSDIERPTLAGFLRFDFGLTFVVRLAFFFD